jgi:hypothetical protein
MSDIKNVSVILEADQEFPTIDPSAKEQSVVSSVFQKFRNSADDRNRNFEYFDGINLIDYIDDCVRRFVTNIDERDDIEDWQSRIHDPFTRNKVIAILGKIIRVLPMAQFTGRGDEDHRKGIILTSLYEYAEEVDDYEELMINVLLECIVKGTAIGYEGLEKKTRLVRNISGTNDEITITEDKETTSRLYGAVVPLEEFYPASVGFRNIKMMPYCFWATEVPYQKFLQDWGMYSRSSRVQPKKSNDGSNKQKQFYQDYISGNIQEGNVEIIRYYNKDVDEYVIIANGVWINPIGNEEISPLPFNHKELPFWDIKYDLFGSDFFYGKSLPDKLKSLQDVLNVLNNMLMDQSFLTIFPPLLTNGFDSIEDDYLRPGRRTPIDTQGLPINQAFMKLDLGTPSGWHQYILEYTRKIMEESSVDQVSQGVAGVGGRTTAQEIRVAADGVASTLGLLGRMVNFGIKRKARLKAANILQFWTDENSPMIEKILGGGGAAYMQDCFNVVNIDNTTLSNGQRGTKIIEMYADKSKMPTKAALKARSILAEKDTGKRIEIVAMPPSYLRDFLYDVKLVANPKMEGSRDVDKALQLEKVRVYMTFFPNIVNIEELAVQTAEKLGDDPTKVIKKDVMNPSNTPSDGTLASEQAPDAGTKPQGATAQNTVKSLNDLQGLQNSMLG